MPKSRLERFVPGCAHHVTLRGNNLRRLFTYNRDRDSFITHMMGASHLGVRVHALVLVKAYVCIVCTPPTSVALARWVQLVSQRYAQWRNKVTGGSGKLFEQRFRAEALRDDAMLGVALAEIDLTPVRAGLVTNVRDYKWSSYALYAREGRSRIPKALIEPLDWHRSLGADRDERASAYAEWVRRCSTEPRRAVAPPPMERYDGALRRPNRTRCA